MNKIRIIFSLPLLLIMSLVFMAANCEKPEPGPNVPKEVQSISKEWRVKRVLINHVLDQSTDYSGYRRRFETDGNYSFTDGPGKVKTGKWKLAGNNQRMVLDEATSSEATLMILNGINTNELHLEVTLPADYKHGERKAVYELIP
jgi:hypothetical protein